MAVSNTGTIRLGGVPYAATGIEVTMGGVEREPIVADDGSVHYKITRAAGGARFTLLHIDDVRLDDVRNFASDTVIVEWDNGRTHTIPNAFVTNNLSLSGGEVSVEISGDPALES